MQIFSDTNRRTAIWNITSAILTWVPDTGSSSTGATGSPIPLLVSQVDISQQANAADVYGLNTLPNGVGKIHVMGDPSGTLTLRGVYDPTNTDALVKFLRGTSGSDCYPAMVTVRPFGESCNKDDGNKNIYRMHGVTLVSWTSTVSIQNGLTSIDFPLQFTFSSIDFS